MEIISGHADYEETNHGDGGHHEVDALPVDEPAPDCHHDPLVLGRDGARVVGREDVGVDGVGDDGDAVLGRAGAEHRVLLARVRHADAVVRVGQGVPATKQRREIQKGQFGKDLREGN